MTGTDGGTASEETRDGGSPAGSDGEAGPGSGTTEAGERGLSHGDLSLAKGFGRLLLRVVRSYPRTLWPLAVAAGLPLAPLVLAWQWPWLRLVRDGVYVNGSLTGIDPTDPVTLGAAAVLGLLALLAAPVALGASVVIATGSLLGRRVAVREAWRLALRRYAAGLGFVMLFLLLLVGSLALFLWLFNAVDVSWPVALAAVLPLLWALLHLTASLPVALAEGRGLFPAMARMWWIGRYRRLLVYGSVLAAFALSVLVRTGGDRLMEQRAGWGDLHPAAAALGPVVSLLFAPLWTMLVCAPAVYGGKYADEHGRTPYTSGPYSDLDLERVTATLPAPAVRGPFRPGRTAAVLAALLLPPLVGPAAVWADPAGSLWVTAYPLESPLDDDEGVDVLLADDGVLVAYPGYWGSCTPVCSADDRPDSFPYARGTSVVATGSEFLVSGWRTPDPVETEDGWEPAEEAGLYVWSCDRAGECSPGERLLHEGVKPWAAYTALALLGDGLVVVSYKIPHHILGEGSTGVLRAHVCADLTCSDPTVVELPLELRKYSELGEGGPLDVAVSPDGGFAVSTYDTAFGDLTVVACSDAMCAEPSVTTVVGTQFDEYEGSLRHRFGARIEYRPDGTPVLAYRAARGGEAHVVDCHDAVCSEFTDRAVTGPGWSRPVPGLALDPDGNPQLATFDMASERLVLISCPDGTCEQTITVPLVEFTAQPTLSELVLDADGRPHVVWGEGSMGWVGFDVDATYLTCDNPLCGKGPAQTP